MSQFDRVYADSRRRSVAEGDIGQEIPMSLHKLWIASGALVFMLVAATPALADPSQSKVTICHGSSDGYVLITVDEHALNGHFDGSASAHGWQNLPDKYPEANGTCAADGGGEL